MNKTLTSALAPSLLIAGALDAVHAEAVKLPEQTIQHLCAVAEEYRAGRFADVDPVIETITGIPPID